MIPGYVRCTHGSYAVVFRVLITRPRADGSCVTMRAISEGQSLFSMLMNMAHLALVKRILLSSVHFF